VGLSAPELVAAAREAAARAHAPYSGIRVGAVIEDGEGRRHAGVNVESASYGLTICAERAALARAVADGARGGLARIAIAREDGAPIVPCGACRQVLMEAAPDLVVVGAGEGGPAERPLRELLPEPFLL
jgi:cytidine deaminase